MSKKYDVWAMKDKYGLIPSSIRRTKKGVVDWWNCLMEDDPFWRWKNYRRRKGCIRKIVKVRLVEVFDE